MWIFRKSGKGVGGDCHYSNHNDVRPCWTAFRNNYYRPDDVSVVVVDLNRISKTRRFVCLVPLCPTSVRDCPSMSRHCSRVGKLSGVCRTVFPLWARPLKSVRSGGPVAPSSAHLPNTNTSPHMRIILNNLYISQTRFRCLWLCSLVVMMFPLHSDRLNACCKAEKVAGYVGLLRSKCIT